ncbi:hypothetical protein [Dyella mobilis]|uniref:DUF4398 domain-containing protein n=1 Tax=Dyella mobilis TaxID=1849582 RepID=A0ABS2KF30_9GAMM|nr:hypothetical protein [Dyella mobilis]MBM7129787.1 hypothetical protein [Dyella mobilis]GLQ97949.1 hypothetical protein GCM10007863_23690 [Dyella mobilis]
MKRFVSVVMMSGLAFVATAALAQQQPVRDISAKHHPNLARAQHQTDAAYKSIVAAQQANEFDLGGHAAKAKDLLDQANRELKQAAEVSNANH